MTLTALRIARLPRRPAISLSALSTLERLGPHRVTELAAVEGVAQSSMTSLVQGLVRAGLVTRRTDPDDRRSSVVAISVHGLNTLRTQRQHQAEDYADLVAPLPPEEAAALVCVRRAIQHLCELANASPPRTTT